MRAQRDPSALVILSSLALLSLSATALAEEHARKGAAPGQLGQAADAGPPRKGSPPPRIFAAASPPGAQAPPGAAVASPGAVRESSASELSFGEPIQYHNITLVPVSTGRKGPFQRYTLLEQGLRARTLAVREVAGQSDAAQVNAVEVRNSGHEPVYLLGGEMILGGKQDRIIQQDTVLGPGGAWTKVAVFCVERGRWDGQKMEFAAGGAIAQPSLRGAAMSGSQGAVWAEVARNNEQHGTQSQTETYRRTIQNEKLRGRIEPYRRELLSRLGAGEQLAGVIFAVNGQIRVADLFGNPVLFSELKDKLLSSYILEGLGQREDLSAPPLSRAAAADWLGKARAAKKAGGKAAGRAMTFSKDSAEAIGSETNDPMQAAPVRETYIRK